MRSKLLLFGLVLSSLFSVSQIVNEGTLKIKDGTTVYFGETFTNKVGATHNNEGNLHLNANFVNNGTVTQSASADAANGITYFDSPTNPSATSNTLQTITGTTKVVFENMVVNMTNASKLGVTVADGLELVVEKGITLTSGDLRLIGEAQLIQKHTGADANSGTDKLLRDQKGTAVTYDYNYFSSPVSGASAGSYTVASVLNDGTDATLNPFSPTTVLYNSGSPYNGIVGAVDGSGNVTTAVTINQTWLYKFDNQLINSDAGWAYIGNSGSLNTGLGFTMKGPGGVSPAKQNYVFKGKPNDGNYSLTINAGNSTLVGNPYPSAIDADAFINANTAVLADVTAPSPTTGALYFWEHWGGSTHFRNAYQGGYGTYTLVGGTAVTSYNGNGGSGSGFTPPLAYKIPVSQGFFVEASAAGGPFTLVFNNSMRVFETEGANSFYYRSSNTENTASEITTLQRIRLGYNNPTGFYRQIMTAFVPECSDGHNNAYDARMADVNNEDMYWLINNIPYVIDARPFRTDLQIPIGITVVNNGIHKIYIDGIDNFNNNIYILDLETGFTHDIRQSDFEVNLTIGTYNDRFRLVFEPQSPLNTDEVINDSLQVFYVSNQENVIIKNPENLDIKSVTIYNTIGQVIKTKTTKTNNLAEISVPLHVASGTYFIKIDTNLGKGSFKIIAY
jgi:hypothetical protein